jgi:hypothetical protein
MSIKQLNATYAPEEDRVQFRFTTVGDEEFRIWLTRALVGQILASSEHLMVKALTKDHAPAQAQMIAEFKQQTVSQTTQFSQQFQGAQKFPLGEQALLAKRVRMSLEGALHVLAFDLPTGQTLTLRLHDELLGKTYALLKKIAETAQWNLQSNIEVAADDNRLADATAKTNEKILH